MSGCTALATKAQVAALQNKLADKVNESDLKGITESLVAPLLLGYTSNKAFESLSRSLNLKIDKTSEITKKSREVAESASRSSKAANGAARQAKKEAYEYGKQSRSDFNKVSRSSKAANEVARQAKEAGNKAVTTAKTAATKAEAAISSAAAAEAKAGQALATAGSLIAALPAILIAIAAFGLIQAQLRATQARVDQQEKALEAYNADYTRLINLISQNNIAINKNNVAIEANNVAIRANESAIAAMNSRLLGVESTNRNLANDFNQASQQINSLTGEVNASRLEAQTSRQESNIASIKANKATVNANIATVDVNKASTEANKVIDIANQNAEVLKQVQGDNNLLKAELFGIKFAQSLTKQAIESSRSATETKFDGKLQTLTINGATKEYVVKKVGVATRAYASGIRDLNGQIVGLPDKFESIIKEQFITRTQKFVEKAQEKVEKTIAATFPEFDLKKVSAEIKAEIGKVEKKFDDRFNETIKDISKIQEIQEIKINTNVDTKIQKLEQVNNKQAAEINTKIDKIDSKFNLIPTPGQIAIAVGSLDILRQIKDKPTPKSLCLAPVYVPPVGAQAKLNGGAIAGLQTVTIAQNGLIQKTVNAVGKTTTKIQEVVTNKTYGLEKIQNFADTAWKATQADKVLQVVNTTLLIHNAMMLSNNLLSTMGEATSMALQAVGIKDHTNNPIDVNTLVRGKITAVLSSVLGAENYKALTARIAKVNRIYQSGINILDATRNMFDATHSIGEVTLRHTGEIGNALRNAGVVAEDSYQEMVEKVNPASKRLMGLEKFRSGVEVAEEAFDSVAQVSGNVLEIQENITQIKSEKQTLITEMDVDKTAKKMTRDITKQESQVTADPAKVDFEAAPPTASP
jgi:hypothetical protein